MAFSRQIGIGFALLMSATLVNLAFAAGVAGIRRRLADAPRRAALGRWLNRGVGAVFVALGLRLALDDAGR